MVLVLRIVIIVSIAVAFCGGWLAHRPAILTRTVWPVHCVVTTVSLPDGGSGPVLACPLWKGHR